MCGIAGIVDQKQRRIEQPLLERMTQQMSHRGPDDCGTFIDNNVGLGHRRLSILDLSSAGKQPFLSENRTVAITYNGEIYNFRKLRSELEFQGHRFRSQTDTEVLLRGYEEWGIDVVHRLNGMFAFAIHDRNERKLILARDRCGIKPVYWYHQAGLFLFASEIKAILRHPTVRRAVCIPALNEYFTFQNVLTDRTLFEGIHLLPQGSTLTLSIDEDAPPRQKQYWDFVFQPEARPAEEVTNDLRSTLIASAERQLISDVPVGSYLSGGMDSGAIVAVASKQVPNLQTFTAGFDLSDVAGTEQNYDESQPAHFMAETFKTKHQEITIQPGDLEEVLSDLIWHLEDLRVGQSYPNYCVARLAGRSVKVVLSGAGGDELFAGYPWRYRSAWETHSREGFHRMHYAYWERLIPTNKNALFFHADLQSTLQHESTFDIYRNVWHDYSGRMTTQEELLNAALYFEVKTFLNGLLVVEDKLSMAHSLESRVPYLDNEMIDVALRIPIHHKLGIPENVSAATDERYRSGKLVLRNAMKGLIPEEIRTRSKQGFSAPDGSWFRSTLQNYVHGQLHDPQNPVYSYLNYPFVQNCLNQHYSGSQNYRLLIWSLLSFSTWLRRFLG